jgi:hypothetical protein
MVQLHLVAQQQWQQQRQWQQRQFILGVGQPFCYTQVLQKQEEQASVG